VNVFVPEANIRCVAAMLPPVGLEAKYTLELQLPDMTQVNVGGPLTLTPEAGLMSRAEQDAGLYVTVISPVVALPTVSLATTVMVSAPALGSVIVALQLAVLAPVAVPPLAVMPLTVTDETPLLPRPLSVAVPLTIRLALVTIAPLTGELIASVGPCVSAGL
jgi:hypothetical protein